MVRRTTYRYNPFSDGLDAVQAQATGLTGPTGDITGPTGPTGAGELAFSATGGLPSTGPDVRDGRALYLTSDKHAYLYQA